MAPSTPNRKSCALPTPLRERKGERKRAFARANETQREESVQIEKENGTNEKRRRGEEEREAVEAEGRDTRDNLFALSVVQWDKKSYLYREEASV